MESHPQRLAAKGKSGQMQDLLADIQRKITDAVIYHKRGQIEEADRLYREILAMYPNHGDSLHLLGLIVHQRSTTTVNLPGKAIGWPPPSVSNVKLK
jgi:hypothetical protein